MPKGISLETDFVVLATLAIVLAVSLYWVHSLRQSKEAIKQSEERLRSIIESSPIPHGIYDSVGKIIYLNQAFNATFGYELVDIPTLAIWWSKAYPDPEYRDWVSTTMQARLAEVKTAGQTVEPLEVEIRCKSGDDKHIVISTATVLSKGNNLHIANFFDITERKRAEEELYLSGRVFNEAHEGIMITDAQEIIIDVNPAFNEITGYNKLEVLGKTPHFLRSGKHDSEFYHAIKIELDEHGYWQGEVWNQKKDGSLYAELLTISTLLDDNGKIVNYLSLFSDVTESIQQQQKLEVMAHYDVLTQLPNRTLFADRFSQAIAHSKRLNSLLAVVFLDLDDFKLVNDSLGHDVGDDLLVMAATRLKDSIREGDTVSRLGGDEFAMLFNDVQSLEHCELTTSRILKAISEVYVINDEIINISASAGITLFPTDDADPDTLLRHADQAMYQAKLKGRNCLCVFDTKEDKQITRRYDELQAIEAAWIADQLCLFYQPKVNMKTGKIIGAEALIRWDHPEKGIIPPLSFLPALNGTELEIKIGNWVIEQAIQQLHEWYLQGIEFEVSINISSHHLQWVDFIKHLDTVLAKYPDISSQCIQLEILESSILTDINAISKTIESCRHLLGVRISLDDFGTGYSSLTHLRHLPVDVVKIDRSFVRDLLDDRDDYTIVDGVIGLTHAFRCGVIAEGVETTEHGLMLMMMGCDHAQGFGIAFPMRTDDFQIWYDNHSPNESWLAYDTLEINERQKLVKLFMLEGRHWLGRLIENLVMEPSKMHYWPVTSYKKSLYALWSDQADRRNIVDKDWLIELDKAYGSLYQVAAGLKQYYQLGELNLARKGVADLQNGFSAIEKALQKYN